MFYADQYRLPPGTELFDANGKKLEQVYAFNPVTGEVIDFRRPPDFLRFLHPGWKLRMAFWDWMYDRGVEVNWLVPWRHYFAPAPIRISVPPDS